MRALRFLLRLIGWLLTPLVAWAASFCGAVLGAALAGQAARATTGIVLTVAMGFAFALLGTHGWLRMIRKSPELQHALSLAPDGTPVAATESADGEPE